MAVNDNAHSDHADYWPEETSASGRETLDVSRSRTAIIALTDRLARRSMPSLVLLITGSTALALFHLFTASSLADGLRSLIWLAMVVTPVWLTAGRLARYRIGGRLSARPLTWRAGHVAGLSVISAALGCGGLMLAGMANPLAASLTLLMLTGLAIAIALNHLPHPRAALAAGLPAFGLLAIWTTTSSSVLTATGASLTLTSVSGLAALLSAGWGWMRYRRIATIMLEQHPREETVAIRARRKKSPRAYNPFRMAGKG